MNPEFDLDSGHCYIKFSFLQRWVPVLPKPISSASHNKRLRESVGWCLLTTHVPWFNPHNQPRKWASFNHPTSLMRKLEVRKAGWGTCGHMTGEWFLDPQPSSLCVHECPREPTGHGHQHEERRKEMKGAELSNLWGERCNPGIKMASSLTTKCRSHPHPRWPWTSALSALQALQQGWQTPSVKGQTSRLRLLHSASWEQNGATDHKHTAEPCRAQWYLGHWSLNFIEFSHHEILFCFQPFKQAINILILSSLSVQKQ